MNQAVNGAVAGIGSFVYLLWETETRQYLNSDILIIGFYYNLFITPYLFHDFI